MASNSVFSMRLGDGGQLHQAVLQALWMPQGWEKSIAVCRTSLRWSHTQHLNYQHRETPAGTWDPFLSSLRSWSYGSFRPKTSSWKMLAFMKDIPMPWPVGQALIGTNEPMALCLQPFSTSICIWRDQYSCEHCVCVNLPLSRKETPLSKVMWKE